jgi:hypothetical protein
MGCNCDSRFKKGLKCIGCGALLTAAGAGIAKGGAITVSCAVAEGVSGSVALGGNASVIVAGAGGALAGLGIGLAVVGLAYLIVDLCSNDDK